LDKETTMNMRKIDEAVYTAILHNQPFSRGNTRVNVWETQNGCLDETVVEVRLHGNRIASAIWKGRPLAKQIDWMVSTCGWDTPTTVRRINAVLKALDGGVTCRIKNGETHFSVGGKDVGTWGTFTLRNAEDIRKGGSHED
jgi:hypothetical protein